VVAWDAEKHFLPVRLYVGRNTSLTQQRKEPLCWTEIRGAVSRMEERSHERERHSPGTWDKWPL